MKHTHSPPVTNILRNSLQHTRIQEIGPVRLVQTGKPVQDDIFTSFVTKINTYE